MSLFLVACGGSASPSLDDVAPTATVEPPAISAPTSTAIPATATPVAATSSPVPATAGAITPTVISAPSATAVVVSAVPTTPPEVVTYDITDFSLEDISVTVGTTVTWDFIHTVPHTVTAGSPPRDKTGEFDSGVVRQGGSFSFTFGQIGVIPYYCTIHPLQMTGTITVTEN